LWEKFRIAKNISKLALSVICALATSRHALGTTFVSSAISNVQVLYYGSSDYNKRAMCKMCGHQRIHTSLLGLISFFTV